MEIEYGTPVVDKNDKALGTVDHIINDMWSGEPRKYMVRLDKETGAVFFTPQHIAKATKEKVKLNVSAEELEQT